LSIYRPIIYGNTATVLTAKERETAHPDHTHRWTVAVRSAASEPDSDSVGGADDLGHFIKRVSFKLHETYPNPTRSKCGVCSTTTRCIDIMSLDIDRSPFEVTETGYEDVYISS
jgi:YEATS domain-containing protein 4